MGEDFYKTTLLGDVNVLLESMFIEEASESETIYAVVSKEVAIDNIVPTSVAPLVEEF